MRIAIFTDTYMPDKNGVSMSVFSFMKLLAADGHQIMIFCPKKGRFYRDKKQTNITIKRYPSITAPSDKNIKLSLPFIWTAVRDLKDFNPDIVHIQTPLGIGLMGIWATKILKIRNIQTYHTHIPDFLAYLSPKALLGIDKITRYLSNSRLARKIESEADVTEDNPTYTKFKLRLNKIFKDVSDPNPTNESDDEKFSDMLGRNIIKLLYNKADLVFTPSKALKDVLERQGVTSKIEVMSNGVNNEMFKVKTDYKIKNKIVYTGRLGFEKSVDVVIQAFYIAQKTNLDLKLDIYGDGPARKSLQVLASKLGIGKKVQFWGPYDINKVSQKICEYDFFVTASTIETQGIVLLEAMSSGLPVVAVDRLAVPEIVLHGKNGYLSEADDAEGMAKNILKMLESSKRLERFGQKALLIAKSHKISKWKDRLFQEYEKISSKK